jgi:hypothetical protein
VIVKSAVEIKQSASAMRQGRLAFLSCLAIVGCAATPVGPPVSGGGATTMFVYAPVGSVLSVVITTGGHYSGQRFALIRDSGRDNHSSRPSGTPSDYVAYSFSAPFNSNQLYTGDLEAETEW